MLSDIEYKRRKDILKDLNDNYNNICKQLENNNIDLVNKTNEFEIKPVTQGEFMKLKEEKFKSIIIFI